MNLLKEKSEREQLLSTNIKYIIDNYSQEIGDINYYHFDFHSHGIKNLRNILDGTNEFVQKNGYYAENLETGQVIKNQVGVVRTNCMDCLDRTNFAQTKIFLLALQQIFEDSGVDLAPIFDENEDFKEKGLAFSDISKSKPIVATVNWYWADNGDAISIHYTGTNSTITKVMKEGKKGFLSSINHRYQDVQRFVNNNFTDNFKEEWIRMILARSKRSAPIGDKDLLESDEKAPNLKIKVITWNIGNNKCDSVEELNSILFKNWDLHSYDLICFNLQEIIKLSAMNVIK